jgi:predicted nucleotide-binding protein (sugar kinase/HSP70/actin superfamily)
MVRPLKEIDPSINIVPLDFDASSTQVNQENRLKLMLANLK